MGKGYSQKDEQEYATELVDAGLSIEQARSIAAKTIATRREKAEQERAEREAGKSEVIDYGQNKPVPKWVKDVINAHLAIEAEDAKKAGELGFLARALVIATMPYREQKRPDGTPSKEFSRVNGNFHLEILSSHGIPYGIYPRLLISWVTTEAVRRQSPEIELGDSLRQFLRDVLEIRTSTGGARGSGTRVLEQMRRLFGALITAEYKGGPKSRGFALKNILIADNITLSDDEAHAIENLSLPLTSKTDHQSGDSQLWTPQQAHEAGAWQSKLVLSQPFFQECVTSPVPIDLRAYRALRASPLAMDIYSWLTYRMSYVTTTTRPIPWESLMLQFGTGYTSNNSDFSQAVRNFKKDFLKALKMVQIVYPGAIVKPLDTGLVLTPSPTHIPKSFQHELFPDTKK